MQIGNPFGEDQDHLIVSTDTKRVRDHTQEASTFMKIDKYFHGTYIQFPKLNE